MAQIVSLPDAIALAVHDDDSVAMEGFTHLIPHAAAHEVIRQRRRGLTLIRMTPDVIYDQMIGTGCARKVYPGISVTEVRERTGWPLSVSASLHIIEPPSAAELTVLRGLLASTPASEGAA